jgi:hypothetical protein
LKLKAKLKQVLKQFITFWLQALNSGRFQCGFDRVNLHRLTFTAPRLAPAPALALAIYHGSVAQLESESKV